MKNIAILGYGVVGSGVYEVLTTNKEEITRVVGEEVCVKHILDRKSFDGEEFAGLVCDDFEKILSDDEVDCFVETMGGVDPAFEFSKRALEKGKIVVSSNKELVEKHGSELMKTAIENGGKYLFEASVGGGIPILTPLSLELAGNKINKIEGIVNGTTNYILTRMKDEGIDFASCLKDAQDLGYAEANPDADVKGYDAARKIAIMTSIVTGKKCSYDDIYIEGIDGVSSDMTAFATALGKTIKLVARMKMESEEGTLDKLDKGNESKCKYCEKFNVMVSPYLLDETHKLSAVNGVFNAVLVEGNAVGETLFYGQGAGKLATASAVVGDVIDALTRTNYRSLWSEEVLEIVDKDDMEVRALVIFKADNAGEIAENLGVELLENEGFYGFFTDVIKEGDLETLLKEKMDEAREVQFVRCALD